MNESIYSVERSIVVLKPKQAFLDWINSTLASPDEQLSLESIRIECNSYLIPEISEIEDGISCVDEIFEDLFKIEFSSWTIDENDWPKQELTLKMFWEWFDVEISPTLVDVSEIIPTDKIFKESPGTIH